MYLIFRWTRTVIHRLLVDEVELDEVELVLVLVAARVELYLFQDRGGDLGLAHLRTSSGSTDYRLVRRVMQTDLSSTSQPSPGSEDPPIQVPPPQVHTPPVSLAYQFQL